MVINNATTADKTYNVTDFISMRTSDEITYYNYSILQYISGNEYFLTNILYDYEDELNDICETVQLSDREI